MWSFYKVGYKNNLYVMGVLGPKTGIDTIH